MTGFKVNEPHNRFRNRIEDVLGMKREMESLWKEVDSRIAKYGELEEKDIVQEIENHRKRRK